MADLSRRAFFARVVGSESSLDEMASRGVASLFGFPFEIGGSMKGPGFRLDLDVRRRWECPDCGRFVRLPGDVTQVNCTCRSDEPVAMRLVERCHKTESPFDHVGFAAQKRIDAALKKPVELPPAEEASETPAPDGDEAVSTVDRD